MFISEGIIIIKYIALLGKVSTLCITYVYAYLLAKMYMYVAISFKAVTFSVHTYSNVECMFSTIIIESVGDSIV